MRPLTFLSSALLCICTAQAQLNKWLVRDLQGVHEMDLTTPTPTVGPLITGFGNSGEEDVNIMTDAANNVLFSMAVDDGTNLQVRDANYGLMPNGDGLISHSSTDQSAICPIPCHADRFFLVHEQTATEDLYYSTVDMTLNGGLGNVVDKNVLIGSGFGEGLAISHRMRTGCRWLFGCLENGNVFQVVKCLIGETGIGPPALIATVNTSSALGVYELELTPDNTKLAISVWSTDPNDPDIVIWDLDLQTGLLANEQQVSVSTDPIIGIQFSPGQGYLYYLGNGNVDAMDFGRLAMSTLTTELIDANAGRYLTLTELAGNGRIYFAQNYNSTDLAEVANPDAPTVGSIGYDHNAVNVPGNGCRPPLPNAIEGEPPGTPPPPGFIEFSASAVGGCDTYQFTDSTCLGTWWEWDLGDGTISYDQSPVHQYGQGTYDVTLRIVACGDTLSLTKPAYIISSTSGPTAAMSFPDTVCAGSVVQFTNGSTGATSYTWVFGDGATSEEEAPAHSYDEPGTWNVQLTATSGCANDLVNGSIVVDPVALAAFTIGGDTCALAVELNTTSTEPWAWDLGDGTTDTVVSPVHVYTGPGMFSITLITGAGVCSDTLTRVVSVATSPFASFTAVAQCDQAVLFTDGSVGASEMEWVLGDGSTANTASFLHLYPGVGPYAVTLTATAVNGCADDTTIAVTPSAEVVAHMLLSGDTCALEVDLVNMSLGSGDILWELGDGTISTDQALGHTYAEAGEYVITLIAAPGTPCADTTTRSLGVALAPVASFAYVVGCDQDVSLTSTSVPVSNVLWDLGDGQYSVADPIVHTYVDPGTYDVTITAMGASGCADDSSASVIVPAGIVAVFEPSSAICDSVRTFINGSQNAGAYSWSFGDGGISTASTPTHIYQAPGDYTVILIAEPDEPCADTTSLSITVGVLPHAAFTDTLGCSLDVMLLDASSYANTVEWHTGDGFIGNAVPLQHAYDAPGTYSVLSIVTSMDGCVDSSRQDIVVPPLVNAAFSAYADPCSPGFTFTNSSTAAAVYHWNFGDGTVAWTTDAEHTYSVPGEASVQLIAWSAMGCSDSTTLDIRSVLGDIPEGMFLPNCFTPNGDGVNDLFTINGAPQCFEATLDIYNRWGEHIFGADGTLTWNGVVDGQAAPEGVYIYVLKRRGGIFRGSVTLLR